MNLAEIAEKGVANVDYPIIKITKVGNLNRSVLIDLNKACRTFINFKEILFFEGLMKIKEPTINTHKPIKLSKNNSFRFVPKYKDIDDMVGIYKVKKLNDCEFELKLMK